MINSRTNERFVPSAVIKGHGTGVAGGRGQGEAAEEEDSEERRHRLRHRRKKKEVTADVLKVKQEVEEVCTRERCTLYACTMHVQRAYNVRKI